MENAMLSDALIDFGGSSNMVWGDISITGLSPLIIVAML